MPRDDFSKDVIKRLRQRVASRCSRPGCGQVTSGPAVDTAKRINVGVVAHICAASRGGPRYNSMMTHEERSSYENGIWLCETCAKLIDSDTDRYTPELLRSWKQAAEARALEELLYRGSPPAIPASEASVLALATQLLDQAILDVPSTSTDVAMELETVREAWREGSNERARRWIAKVRTNEEQWGQLVPALRRLGDGRPEGRRGDTAGVVSGVWRGGSSVIILRDRKAL
jgi:hypothetical protein